MHVLQIKTRYRHAVARAFATVSMLVLLLAARAHAQTETRLAAAAQLETIVFLVPADLDAQTRASLEDALVTQLALIQVRLVLLDGPTTPPALEERVIASKSIAAEHAAVGVLWLELRPGDRWFVYATDAEAERVVVRPLLVRPESVASAVETVAVIARGSAEALLHGEPVMGEPVRELPAPPQPSAAAAPPPRPPAPRAAAPEHAGLRLSLAYAGSSFASDQPWQSGAQVSAAWLWANGSHVGIAYTWYPAHRFGDVLVVSLQRRPFTLAVGHSWKLAPRLRLDAELGATVDVLSRHTVATPSGTAAKSDATRVQFAIAPGLRGDYELVSWLSAFLGLGCDVFINDFDYLTAPSGGATLLDPHRVRLRALAGLSIVH